MRTATWVLIAVAAVLAGLLLGVALLDRHGRLQRWAAEDPTVARAAQGGDVKALADLARSRDVPVASEAVRALGRCGHAGLPDLRGLLKDPRPKVRVAAVLALRRAADAETDSALAEAARDGESAVRAAAVSVLGHHKAWRHGDVLIDAMEDADPAVRDRAAVAFREVAGAGLDPRAAGPERMAGELRALWPEMRQALEAYYARRETPEASP
jgi:HEAT repeat protein